MMMFAPDAFHAMKYGVDQPWPNTPTSGFCVLNVRVNARPGPTDATRASVSVNT